jgi:hypothetical protein
MEKMLLLVEKVSPEGRLSAQSGTAPRQLDRGRLLWSGSDRGAVDIFEAR